MQSKFWFEFLQTLPTLPGDTVPVMAIQASPGETSGELIIAQATNQTLDNNNSSLGGL